MAQNDDARDFRDVMESYFDDCLNLTRAAKAVGLATLPEATMLATLWGLIEVLDKTATEARKDIEAIDRRQMAARKPVLVRTRA
jgi:hypothetical protein